MGHSSLREASLKTSFLVEYHKFFAHFVEQKRKYSIILVDPKNNYFLGIEEKITEWPNYFCRLPIFTKIQQNVCIINYTF